MSPKAEKENLSKQDVSNRIKYRLGDLKELRDMKFMIEDEVPEAKSIMEKKYSALKREVSELVKQYNSMKKSKIRKSRLERMWKVFGIEMPETLEKSEDFDKANEGVQKLQKCITKQGKDEAEVNRIVNRAVIEKYNLLEKGAKNFKNYKDWVGGQNFNVTEGPDSALEMAKIRKSDAEARFSGKQYVEQKEELVNERQTDINQRVANQMKHENVKWDGFKEFKEQITKSEPSEFEKSRQADQDGRWNSPEWSGKDVDIKDMNPKPVSTINERIQAQQELKKSRDVDFGDRYKAYDENSTKAQKAPKTNSELLHEEIEKRNWGVDGEEK